MFIDTSSLLAQSARAALLSRLLPELAAAQATALVSVRTANVLQERAARGDDDAAAREALDVLTALLASERVLLAEDPHAIAGGKHDTAALYPELFIGFQHKKVLCLVTENAALALQVLRNARLAALNDKHGRSTVKGVFAAYIEDGQLKNWVPRLAGTAGGAVAAPAQLSIEQQIAGGFKVIADTSSLMLADIKTGELRGAPFFADRLFPLFQASGNHLMVPERVMRELENHAASPNPALCRQSAAGSAALARFGQAGLLIRGEDEHEVMGTTERFADPVFLKLAIRFQQDYRLCFITQDTRLAEALLENRLPGNEQRFLVAYIAMKSGHLAHWENKLAGQKARATATEPAPGDGARAASAPADQRGRHEAPSRTARKPPPPSPGAAPRSAERQAAAGPLPFKAAAEIAVADNRLIAVAQPPLAGARVFGRASGELTLGEVIAAGGEGTIHATDRADTVCKIYHKHCLTTSRLAKIELMLSRGVHIHGVCWPTDMVTTSGGEFVGYLMPKGQGKILKTAVFAKPLLLRTFPHWTRLQLTQLAITILRTIDRLHQLNIFIGDINPQNILVKDERNIAIVDADSFQVEGFPCPVGTETFTPPARQGQNYGAFLRSRDDELFAVTTLMFMILFPGKAPYSSQGGGEAAENIRNRRFAYGRDADGRPPVGSWQFIWSHLHPALKDVFTAVFSNGERVAIEQMVASLQRSMADMKDGRRSDALFPDGPRQREGSTVRARCDSCPPDKAEQDISIALAERLREQGRQFRCSDCANLRKIGRLESTRDADCALRLSPQCQQRSAVPVSHLDNLKANNRAYWCKPCAEAQKQAWATQRARGRATPCFVATASYCSEDAPQVVFLRQYRDRVLRRTRAGRAFIAVYYRVGPWLAAVVDAMPRLRPVCRRALDALIGRIRKTHPHLPQ